MINGFEKQTHPLKPEEMQLAKEIAIGISRRTKTNPVTNAQICAAYKEKRGKKLGAPRIRKIIHYIRVNHMTDLPIVSSSKGYWVTNDKRAVVEYLAGFKQRIDAMQAVYDSFKHYL